MLLSNSYTWGYTLGAPRGMLKAHGQKPHPPHRLVGGRRRGLGENDGPPRSEK
jgi:hypothetical protein